MERIEDLLRQLAEKNKTVNDLQEEIFRLQNKNVIDLDKEEMATGYKDTAEALRKRLKDILRERDDLKGEYDSRINNQ